MLTIRRRCGDAVVRVDFTERSDAAVAGLIADLHEPRPALHFAASAGEPGVTVLAQVHGSLLVRAATPGEHCGTEADASWTTCAGATLAIRTADCVPVALYGLDDRGGAAAAAVHAGWRGLLDGVIEAALESMAAAGFGRFRAVVGPHISVALYEFGTPGLPRLADVLGPAVVGKTAWGTDALDLAEATRIALRRGGAELDFEMGRCTATDSRYFSHRANGDTGRTAMLVSLEHATEPDAR